MTAILWMILAFTLLPYRSECHEAVLHVSDGDLQQDYCLVYNASWSNISKTLSDAVRYRLVNLTSTMLCDVGGVKPDVVKGTAVCVMRGDCAFSIKAQVAQKLGAAVLLIVSQDAMGTPTANASDYDKVSIPLALMRYRDFLDVQKVFTERMEVQLYAPPTPEFDASVIIMLAVAVFTVTMGGFWSGAAEKAKQSVTAFSTGEDKSESGDLTLYSPLKVLLFVVLMCVMLLLMYFFYRYLVYVIIVIFCLASATVCCWFTTSSLSLSPRSSHLMERASWCRLLSARVLEERSGDVMIPADPTPTYEKHGRRTCVRCSSPSLGTVTSSFQACWWRTVTGSMSGSAAQTESTTSPALLMGQPALLYLVPFTLLTSALLAWKRKEFKQFWAGTTYQVSSPEWTSGWFGCALNNTADGFAYCNRGNVTGNILNIRVSPETSVGTVGEVPSRRVPLRDVIT
ncbi:hypothetical protein HF521_003482 [Silurus meridionalis]|uniref:PA domain-containing protein n=1 Tax=Silurus meridionalis TaxID=175797 RepID=A0A8T0AYH9_SILME|nr:hypothetical protein HF521_003482 [Silurus meridionalis]